MNRKWVSSLLIGFFCVSFLTGMTSAKTKDATRRSRSRSIMKGWPGYFTYQNAPSRRSTPFRWKLTCVKSVCKGESSELNTIDPDSEVTLLNAKLSGTRTANTLTVIKTYDGSAGMTHDVLYLGTLFPGTTDTFVGVWNVDSSEGLFKITLEDAKK